MARERVIETMDGIQDAFDVAVYDREMRRMRRRGLIETPEILKAGITSDVALEISPGPGYLGIDWLSRTEGTTLVGLDISENMLALCRSNADVEGLGDRATYVHGDACSMPFGDATFDGVFANGGLHEWADPAAVFGEVARVLKPSGRYCITDLRRDMSPFIRWAMLRFIRERSMRRGLISSINAAYTPAEARRLAEGSRLPAPRVSANAFGLSIVGRKDDASPRDAGSPSA
jgi:ubiquinone/menaquinone biosynthesis C-methylase UbiE